MARNPLWSGMPPISDPHQLQVGANDVVIHAPGFEERTIASLELIISSGGGSAILLDYSPFDSRNRLSEVRSRLTSIGIETLDSDIVEYNRFDPTGYVDVLRRRLIDHATLRTIVDVSTMSKLAIILTLKVCWELDLEVTVLYSEAEDYGPSREEFDTAKARHEIHRPTLQIYTGVHGVVRAGSVASVAMQGQPTAALVFMSFNEALTQVLLNTVCPSRLLLINGRPPVHSWRQYATAWIHDEVRREWESDNPVTLSENGGHIPTRAVSTLDYRETVALLIELYWQLSETHRVLLAPAGSKMQAVGCFFAKMLHPDIHIEYPSPEGFLPRYSSGIGKGWVLRLGRVRSLIGSIGDMERRAYLEVTV